MKDLENKLSRMQKLIDEKSQEKSRIEGALASVMDELKNKNNIESLDELSKLIDEKEIELGKLEDDFKKKMEKLEEDYDWNF